MTRTHFSDLDAALRRSFTDVVNAAEELLRSTADDAGVECRRARRTLESSVRSARQRIADNADDLAAEARSIGKGANRLVRDNPWASAGIGAAIGLIAGVLLRRR